MRLFWYAIFVAIAAPIDIILDWWGGLTMSRPAMLWAPFADALIYLYAFVISVEALFRMSQHQARIRNRAQLHLVIFLALIPIALFVIDYVGELRPLIWSGVTVASSAWRQMSAAGFGLIASLLSFMLTDRLHAPRSQYRRTASRRAT